jgi:hypothetical protein
MIGVWDVASAYAGRGEIPPGGLGSNDLRLMPGSDLLIVANGGIATDRSDRRKLNLGTMRPNLAYLDLSGRIADQLEVAPALRQNSIRHLAVRRDGVVGLRDAIGGRTGQRAALLGLRQPGAAPLLAKAPLADELAMQGYAGSIAFGGDGRELAITSTRGGRVHRFSSEGAFRGPLSRADVCGLAPLADGFLASDGFGGLIALRDGTAAPLGRMECA